MQPNSLQVIPIKCDLHPEQSLPCLKRKSVKTKPNSGRTIFIKSNFFSCPHQVNKPSNNGMMANDV